MSDRESSAETDREKDAMRCRMEGRIELSGPVPAEAVGAVLAAAERDLLAKGAPEGRGARIASWSVDGATVRLALESGPWVRPHDAIARLRKALGAALGRTHRVGPRSYSADAYEVRFALGREPLHPVAVPLGSVSFKGCIATLRLEGLDEALLGSNAVDRLVALVREKVDAQYYEGKAEHWEELWASGPREHAWDEDPTEAMVRLGWLKQGPTKGRWFYRPQLAAVLRAMERIAIEEVLLPLGFQEVIEPHHVPFEVWLRTGHMAGNPNEIYYVCEPRTRDPAAWEGFRDHVKVLREVPRDRLADLLSPPAAGICYAQCPVVYWSFQNATIAESSLPVLVFDRAANSNRYESGGRHGIERVDEFHRIEPVYIGTREHLLDLRERLIDRYKHVFNDILELEWRMAWVTPFYMQQAGLHGTDDADGGHHELGTIDFEAYLPYRGGRAESEWLEFQNLSIVGDKYTKAFAIKGQRSQLWSGCSGIGLERWCAAFLAQKGLDPSRWPEGFRRVLPELPRGIELL